MAPVNPLGEVLGVDDVHLDLDASTKAELLEQLAGLVAGRHGTARDTETITLLPPADPFRPALRAAPVGGRAPPGSA